MNRELELIGITLKELHKFNKELHKFNVVNQKQIARLQKLVSAFRFKKIQSQENQDLTLYTTRRTYDL
jgi:hypothetical protein